MSKWLNRIGVEWPSPAPTSTRLVPLLTASIPSLLLYHLSLNPIYTPRGFDYSNDLIPLFLSPWALSSIPDLVSRLIQCVVIYLYPPTYAIYLFWFTLALIRAGLGYLLTRSVGWAYPPLFHHWALYESSTGWGPCLLAWISIQQSGDLLFPILAVTFCWLENRPWTYGTTLCMIVILHYRHLIPYFRTKEEAGLPPPKGEEPEKSSIKPILLSFFILLPYLFIRPARLPQPPVSLDIVMLSFPRPIEQELNERIISTTIESYLPYTSPTTTLSIFTHSTTHPAFSNLSSRYPSVTFRMDDDQHPDDVQGQYLHLAEALRWASEREGEWLVLLEDDFPICPGGWEIFATMLNMLEQDRTNGILRSGFFGTGGSGFIIHKSYLRLLQLQLRTYSQDDSVLIPVIHRRAPDQIIQDCLLGRPNSLCERRPSTAPTGLWGDNERRGNVIISDRIVIDHIGGMATTTGGKALNSDKWRCGWRHPFHGDGQVDVIVV